MLRRAGDGGYTEIIIAISGNPESIFDKPGMIMLWLLYQEALVAGRH